jgi:F420-dependent oxidoreductase-like protein
MRGILLSSDYIPPKMLLDYIGMIEDAGYDMVVVPEIWGRDSFTFIAQALQVTSKLKFATGIVNIYSRSPATLAMTAASLAELSEGRFVLGLGASGPKVIEDLHGIPYGKPLKRTREVVAIIRTLLNNERLNFSGDYFKVKDFKLSIHNEYKIPIWIASLGPKNIELTGEIADGWYPIWAPKSKFGELMDYIQKGLNTGGKKRQDFTVAPFLISCTSENPELTTKLAQKHIAYYIGKMGSFYFDLAVRMGYSKEAEGIRNNYLQDREKAASFVSTDMLKDLTITGTIEEAQKNMNEWEELTDVPLIALPFKTPPEIAFETIQALAPK